MAGGLFSEVSLGHGDVGRHILLGNGNVEILGSDVLKGALCGVCGNISSHVFGNVNCFIGSLVCRNILLGKSGVYGHILRHVASMISSDVLLNNECCIFRCVLLEKMDSGRVLRSILVCNDISNSSRLFRKISSLILFSIGQGLNVHEIVLGISVNWKKWLLELFVPVWGVVNCLWLTY